ncbi:MAG: hypothetical protein HY907_12395 [Deltaproteobacteria bacterium]|nr:hypothetical protein [Deltaproteobacteria bacterium]
MIEPLYGRGGGGLPGVDQPPHGVGEVGGGDRGDHVLLGRALLLRLGDGDGPLERLLPQGGGWGQRRGAVERPCSLCSCDSYNGRFKQM